MYGCHPEDSRRSRRKKYSTRDHHRLPLLRCGCIEKQQTTKGRRSPRFNFTDGLTQSYHGLLVRTNTPYEDRRKWDKSQLLHSELSESQRLLLEVLSDGALMH